MIRNIRLLCIHNFLVDFRLQDAFRPIYFAQITGSYTLAMAVFSVAWITSALADIPTGVFSDKMGRKFTIVLASTCSTTHCYVGSFRTQRRIVSGQHILRPQRMPVQWQQQCAPV
jgi:MFS family permease